jgi:uncharacterized membrane protein
MDNPIISPWIFYVANLCDDISRLVCILAAVAFVIALCFLGKWCDYSEEEKQAIRSENKKDLIEIERKQAKHNKRIKLTLTFFVVCLLANTFIPSSNTIYRMMAANLATPKNIEYMKTDAVQFIKDIAQAITEAQNNVHS